MSGPPIGVLAMAYGTASGPDDVERYYTDIRGGRAPDPRHLEELKARYAAIGNRFPLLEITGAQADGLERALNDGGDDPGFRVYLGMKHSPPFIAEGVARMRDDGVERAVGLVLAPHWSGMSVETYVDRVEKAVADTGGPAFTYVRQWYDHPDFLDLLARRVASAIDSLPSDAGAGASVIVSAHSLPTRALPDGSLRCKACDLCADGCRYVAQLEDTRGRLAALVGVATFVTGWQSAGRTPDPWWGPAVEDVIRDLAGAGYSAVVACSAGFVADHLEILYDLDVAAREEAEEAGLAFHRIELPNTSPTFIRALAEVALAQERAAQPAR
jgi:protoporphyrin/coproporphyrin ferrochelatase